MCMMRMGVYDEYIHVVPTSPLPSHHVSGRNDCNASPTPRNPDPSRARRILLSAQISSDLEVYIFQWSDLEGRAEAFLSSFVDLAAIFVTSTGSVRFRCLQGTRPGSNPRPVCWFQT